MKPKRTNYSRADWSKTNSELAKEFGVPYKAIYKARKRRSISNIRKPDEKYMGLDWSKTTKELANETGIPYQRLSHKRRVGNFPNPRKHQGQGQSKIDDLDYNFKIPKGGGGGSVWSHAVKRRLGEACKICEYYRPPVVNHSHHILPLSEGGKNTIRNGTVLCPRCHEEVHAGLLTL